MYSIIHLSVWTCGYLFYTLGYNSTPHHLFYCWNCPSFSHQELFHLTPVLLTHAYHFWLGGLEGYFLTFWYCKMLILGMPGPNSRVSHSSKELQGTRYVIHVLMARKASPKWLRHLSMCSNSRQHTTVATTVEIQGQSCAYPGPSVPLNLRRCKHHCFWTVTITLLALSQSWALGPALLSLKL